MDTVWCALAGVGRNPFLPLGLPAHDEVGCVVSAVKVSNILSETRVDGV